MKGCSFLQRNSNLGTVHPYCWRQDKACFCNNLVGEWQNNEERLKTTSQRRYLNLASYDLQYLCLIWGKICQWSSVICCLCVCQHHSHSILKWMHELLTYLSYSLVMVHMDFTCKVTSSSWKNEDKVSIYLTTAFRKQTEIKIVC